MTRLAALFPEALLRRAECLTTIRNEDIDEVVRRALELYVADLVLPPRGASAQGTATWTSS